MATDATESVLIVSELNARDLFLMGRGLREAAKRTEKLNGTQTGLWLPDLPVSKLFLNSPAFAWVRLYQREEDPRMNADVVESAVGCSVSIVSTKRVYEISTGNLVTAASQFLGIGDVKPLPWLDFSVSPYTRMLESWAAIRSRYKRIGKGACFFLPGDLNAAEWNEAIETIQMRWHLLPVVPVNFVAIPENHNPDLGHHVVTANGWEIVQWLLVSEIFVGAESWISCLASLLSVPSIVLVSEDRFEHRKRFAIPRSHVQYVYLDENGQRSHGRNTDKISPYNILPEGSGIPEFYALLR